MESLDDVLEKRQNKSLIDFMKLVDPERKYRIDLKLGDKWDALSLTEQRRLYLYLLYRKWRGIDIYGDPYTIIRYCHPVPFNWNQHPLGQTLIAERKAIIAKYQGSFGTYTRDEATLYDMTDKSWFLCQLKK